MKWPQVVLALTALTLMLGGLVVQTWVWESQYSLYQAQMARHQADLERQQAAAEQWLRLQKERPGQFIMPPPSMLQSPPFVSPPIFFPWFTIMLPLMIGPLAWSANLERQRMLKAQQQEEDEQTLYTPEDLMDNWEFKIIRSPIGLFGQSAFLDSVLREEAQAGWQLVEKFDCARVRLKRRAGQPPRADLPEGYDPYRTYVGPQAKLYVLWWALSILCAILAPVLILKQFFEPSSPAVFWTLLGVAVAVSVALSVLAMRQMARYRKLADRN